MEMIKKVPPLVCKGEKNLTFYQNGKLMITSGKVSRGWAGPLPPVPHEQDLYRPASVNHKHTNHMIGIAHPPRDRLTFYLRPMDMMQMWNKTH